VKNGGVYGKSAPLRDPRIRAAMDRGPAATCRGRAPRRAGNTVEQERQTLNDGVDSSAESDDALLLGRIAAGDRNAFRKLYTMYHHRILRFIRRLTGRLDLAEEGVNDVMLVVWRNSQSFDGRSKVSTWIMGIAYRKALKLLDASRRWSFRFKASDFDTWIEHAEAPAAQGSDGIELRDLLDRALAELSPDQRAVVELTYFGGYSYLEIATITSCPENTVKTRMFHARAKLRRLLPSLGEDIPSRWAGADESPAPNSNDLSTPARTR
jgi:RNA polymerase sigma-70 factor, ECF subfamily